MDTHLSTDLTEHLPQQCKQSHYHLPGLLVSVLALLPILKVHVFYIVALEYSGFGLFFMSTVFPSIRTMIHFRSAPMII